MIDNHDFHLIPYTKTGPILNQYGLIIAVAEIDDTWFVRWRDPNGKQFCKTLPDHESCIQEIQKLNSIARG